MQAFSGKVILLCALSLCILVPTYVFAELPISHRVNVAVSFDAPFDLITSVAICENDKICHVISNQAHGINVTLKLHSDTISSFGDLSLQCKDECSFATGKSTITFRDDRKFDVFRGRDTINVPLVLKPRTKIGEISLIVERAPH